jgi:hypothetical protein
VQIAAALVIGDDPEAGAVAARRSAELARRYRLDQTLAAAVALEAYAHARRARREPSWWRTHRDHLRREPKPSEARPRRGQPNAATTHQHGLPEPLIGGRNSAASPPPSLTVPHHSCKSLCRGWRGTSTSCSPRCSVRGQIGTDRAGDVDGRSVLIIGSLHRDSRLLAIGAESLRVPVNPHRLTPTGKSAERKGA